MKEFSHFLHFSKFLGKCKFATLGIVGSRTVWRHLQAFLPEWIQPWSVFPKFVLLFHLWHSQVVYHSKWNTHIPPEHLQVHIQDHSHLSLNNATGIPQQLPNIRILFFYLLMLLTAAWATLRKIAQDHLEKNYKETGSFKFCYRCWSLTYPIQFIHVFNYGLS